MADGTFAGPGRLPGQDVCRNGTLNGISPCMYISHIYYVSFKWENVPCIPSRLVSHAYKQSLTKLLTYVVNNGKNQNIKYYIEYIERKRN